MNDWMVDGGAVERVHGGVMRRIRRRRAMRRGAGVAAVLAVLAIGLWPGEPAVEQLALHAPAAPVAPVWTPMVAKARVAAKAVGRPAEKITLYTADPDVVIVLVADGGTK